MTETSVVIVGGKGTALNIAEQIEDARNRFRVPIRVLGFAIDDPALGKSLAGLPVLCGVREAWTSFQDSGVKFIFALYRPDVVQERYAMIATLGIPADRFASFIHPSAYVSPSANVGPGVVVLSHSSVLHRVSIGAFSIVNTNVVIEHESDVGPGVFVAASACIGARTRIGTAAFIGLNATIREDVSVGEGAFVGMAATVIHDVAPGQTVYGSPAKVRR